MNDSDSCFDSIFDARTGTTTTSRFKVTSLPTGAEKFVTIDHVKSEFKANPITNDQLGTYTVRITAVPLDDWIEFQLNVSGGGTDKPWLDGVTTCGDLKDNYPNFLWVEEK